MTTIAKPGLDVDVIAVPDFALKCIDSRCDESAIEMALHATCGGAMATCAYHGFAIRHLLAAVTPDRPRYHVACDQPVTVDNVTFRSTN